MNGTLLGFYVGGTLISHSTDNSITVSHSPRSATTKDSGGWTDNLEGLREWSGSGEAMLAEDATYGHDDLMGLVVNRTEVTLRFSTEVSGDKYYQGQAYIDSLEISSAPEESVTFSYSFTGNGELQILTNT
jgi:TP901-1 family phage major tail protein